MFATRRTARHVADAGGIAVEITDEDWQQAITSWMPLAAELLEGWRVVRAKIPTQANPAWMGHPHAATDRRRGNTSSPPSVPKISC